MQTGNNRASALRRSLRAGLAFVTATAVTIGGVVVAPPVLAAAPIGTKATFEEKQGETILSGSALQASDIGDTSSCQVQFFAEDDSSGGLTDPEKDKAGMRMYVLNPSSTSEDKYAFGVQYKVTGDKQRTFNNIFVTDSVIGVKAAAPILKAVEVGPGLSADFPAVNRKSPADMDIEMRKQTKVEFSDTMSADLVEKMATSEGGSSAWKGSYASANPTNKLFVGGNFEVNGFVNPWPSENDNCSTITVDRIPMEKQPVIKPGEQIAVGKVKNADENSLKRIRVQAVRNNGEVIDGDTHIDADGTIRYTWPEFKGKPWSDDDAITFRVIALPRDLAGLKEAAKGNDEYGEGLADHVYDTSLSAISRYNQPNEIGTLTLSTDDEKHHKPEYAENQKALLSGVENGKPTTEKQSVVFTETGDKIADLVKNQNATVEIDDELVQNGWKAEFVDAEHGDYTVKVTAPNGNGEPRPGTFAQPVVRVTYTNGSVDTMPLLVVVRPNNTQITDASYEEPTHGAQGQELTSPAPKLIRQIGKGAPIQPKKYEVIEDTIPAGWTVTVDEKTGVVTAKSPEDEKNNRLVTPKIRVTYPDGTTDEAPVSFQVASHVKTPDYGSVTGKVGQSEPLTLTPAIPKIGLSGSENDQAPVSYSFPDGSTTRTFGEWEVSVDPKTGQLSTTVPAGALPGAELTIPVKASYSNGAHPVEVTGTFKVVGKEDGSDQPKYPPVSTRAGNPVTTSIESALADPKLAKYDKPKNIPAGWTVTVDDAGTVTATPPQDARPGDKQTFDIPVTYPDGSTTTVPATITVVGRDKEANDPKYATVTGKPGTTVKSPLNDAHMHKSSEPKFSIITDPAAPGYIAPPRNISWDKVKIDPDTGEITTPISEYAVPGSSADVPVKVTYKDGSEDYTYATVVVKGDLRSVYGPDYNQQITKPGEPVTSPILDELKVPARDLDKDTPFTVPTTLDGWTVSVDKDGNVTATPPKDAKPGDAINVPVKVKYQDGTDDTVFAPFVVKKLDKDIHEPGYPVESTKPGTPVTHKVTPAGLPAGTTFTPAKKNVDGWDYKVDKKGNVTVTPPKDAKPGDKKTFNVTVTYPDGSTEEVPVTTVVNLSNTYEAEPSYPTKDVYPGEETSVPLSVDKPEDLGFAKDTPFQIQTSDTITATGTKNADGNPVYTVKTANGDWTVSLDKNGNVLTTAPAGAKPGDQIAVPVTVTYADGSTDTATAPIHVVDNPTEIIPFEVEYKTDPNLAAGEKRVTPGKPGKKVQNRDGSWTTVEEPSNEIVVIGTKPAESTNSTEWEAEIPFKATLKPNPELKPGETRVVTEGTPGKKKFTADFTAVGSDSKVKPKEEVLEEPVDRVVEYGPALDPTELTTTMTSPVPFETEVVFDDTLPAGEKKVVTPGEHGEDTTTSVQKLVDGTPSGDPDVTTKRTKDPVKQVIHVGTKTSDTDVNKATVEIPFETEVIYDDTLPAGTFVEDKPGKAGTQEITTTLTIVDSKVTGRQVDKKRLNEPEKRVIRVGTKGKRPENPSTWEEPTAFTTIVRETTKLPQGKTQVVQNGIPGTATFTLGENGDVKREVSKKPVDQIIEIGTSPTETTIRETTTVPVPFETKVVFDDTLPAGTMKTDQEGKNGERVTESAWTLVNGEKQGEPVRNTTDTAQPTPRIIRVGTKTATVTNIPPAYSKAEQEPGTSVTVPTFESSVFPEGATYEIDPNWKPAVDGWTASVAEDGTVTSTAPKTAKPGDNVVIPVIVTFGDGTKTTVPAMAGIPGTPGETATRVQYGVQTVKPSESATDTPSDTTDGTTYAVPPTVDGWTVVVDKNGNVTATAPKDAKPGDFVTVPVTVTPATGEPYVAKAVFTVTGETAPIEPQPEEPEKPKQIRVPSYPPAIITGSSTITVAGGHTDGTSYALGTVPEGWTATIDKTTGALTVTPPKDAPSGTTVDIPVLVTLSDGTTAEIKTVVAVAKGTDTPTPAPSDNGSSSDEIQRCFANAFAVNSPILWLLPVAILAAIGGPLSQALQPQIDAASAQINGMVQAHLRNLHRDNDDHGDRGIFGRQGRREDRPEWMREAEAQINAQINAINQQFAPIGKQLEPLGYALGALGLVALASSLIAQACQPEGFDHGMTIFGSSAEGDVAPGSSEKGAIHDAIMNGSSSSEGSNSQAANSQAR